jgi:hypothetical protein
MLLCKIKIHSIAKFDGHFWNLNFLSTVKPRLIWHVKLENHVDIESILCCFSQRKRNIRLQYIRALVGKGSCFKSWQTWKTMSKYPGFSNLTLEIKRGFTVTQIAKSPHMPLQFWNGYFRFDKIRLRYLRKNYYLLACIILIRLDITRYNK